MPSLRSAVRGVRRVGITAWLHHARLPLRLQREHRVSLFDGYGRAVLSAWSGGLASGVRFSFQNLEGARSNLRRVTHESGHAGHTCTFDLADSVGQDDWAHATRCFQKRHVLAHKLGVVDEGYLAKADDPDAVLGSPVTVTPQDIDQLLTILAKLGKHLYAFYIS